jgi:hypothetical protein
MNIPSSGSQKRSSERTSIHAIEVERLPRVVPAAGVADGRVSVPFV